MRPVRTELAAALLAAAAVAAMIPFAASRAEAATPVFDFSCASSGSAVGDFDNDGRPDLAVGAPGDDLEPADGAASTLVDAGSINVTYSTSDGLDPSYAPATGARRFFSQNTPGLAEDAESADAFGFAVASGNFDGAGGDDLAIGVPGDNGTGAVQILYSGPKTSSTATTTIGLHTDGSQLITQETPNVEGTAQAGEAFGYALAAGDLNRDGKDDLAIGSPRANVGGRRDAGTVNILYGSARGLTPQGPSGGGSLSDQLFEQGPGPVRTPEVGRAEAGDLFGASIAIGQFNDGGPLDLAIGAPGEDVGQVPDGGSVRVLYGRRKGVVIAGDEFFHENASGVVGTSGAADRFGCALSSGDYDSSGGDDLAVGAPGEPVGGDKAAGAVHVIYNSGRMDGLSAAPAGSAGEDDLWVEDSAKIPGDASANDRFGSALASGDFNNDKATDLAIGLPKEGLNGHTDSGSIRVLFGARTSGLGDANATSFAQTPTDIASSCPLYGVLGTCIDGPSDYSPLLMIEEDGDRFGASIVAADFDKSGTADLAIGAPGEDLGLFANWATEEELTIPDELLVQLGIPASLEVDEVDDAGAINIVYGPFAAAPASPEKQDLLYRAGNSPFSPLRDGILHQIPILEDNQIHVTPADESATGVLAGDGFGSSQG